MCCRAGERDSVFKIFPRIFDDGQNTRVRQGRKLGRRQKADDLSADLHNAFCAGAIVEANTQIIEAGH